MLTTIDIINRKYNNDKINNNNKNNYISCNNLQNKEKYDKNNLVIKA